MVAGVIVKDNYIVFVFQIPKIFWLSFYTSEQDFHQSILTLAATSNYLQQLQRVHLLQKWVHNNLQDQSGTNALNTDIVLQLSDNGSNFSTATLTALPDFSSY